MGQIEKHATRPVACRKGFHPPAAFSKSRSTTRTFPAPVEGRGGRSLTLPLHFFCQTACQAFSLVARSAPNVRIAYIQIQPLELTQNDIGNPIRQFV